MSGGLLDPREYPEWLRADLARRYGELAAIQIDLVLRAVETFAERVEGVADTFATLEAFGAPVNDRDGWLAAARAFAASMRKDLVEPSQAEAVDQAERFMNEAGAGGASPDRG